MKIKVTKRDGRLEDFDKNKIIKSCIEAGATEEIARKIANEVETKIYDKIPTSEIRCIILNELGKVNPEWRDNWEFYDWIVKKRITFESGRYVEIRKGNLYLGREVRDIGEKGLTHLEEVEGILRELEEDLKYGIPRQKIHRRTYVLFMAVLKSKKMNKETKLKAIELINNFRIKMGWKPFKPKKPIE